MAGLLAGLDALLIALGFAVVLLVLTSIIRPLLVSVLGSAPFIGGWLASNVGGALGRFSNSLQGPANAALGVLSGSLGWLEWAGRSLVTAEVALHTAALSAISDLRRLDIPAALASAVAHAEGLASDLRAWTLLGIQDATNGLRGLIDAAASNAAGWVLAARLEAQGLFSVAESDAVALEGKAEGLALDLVNGARAEAVILAGRAEAVAQSLNTIEHEFATSALLVLTTDVQRVEAAAHVALSDTAAILGADITEAEKRAGDVAAQLAAPIEASLQGILASTPWGALAAAVGVGEEMLKADVETLVRAGAAEIRRSLGDAESIRARYGPQVRAALAQIKAGG